MSVYIRYAAITTTAKGNKNLTAHLSIEIAIPNSMISTPTVIIVFNVLFSIIISIPFALLKAQNVMKKVPSSIIYFIIKPIGVSVYYKSRGGEWAALFSE